VNHNFFGEVKDNLLLYIFAELIESGSEINSAQVTTLYEYLSGVFNLDPARLKQLQALKHEFDVLDKPLPLKVLEQELTTTKGKSVSLSQVLATNEAIYIGFWASTCNTCTSEMAAQKQLVDELQGKGIKFILISFDEDIKRWQKAISKMKIKADHYLIKEGFASAITQYISFTDIPKYLLFDSDGRLVRLDAPIPSALVKDKSTLLTLIKKSLQ
jgi:thiol-disulfide isomerase/thioredoxin